MKKLIAVVFCSLFTLPILAQHDPQFSLNQFNMPAISPAVVGLENGVSASALIREQWIGIEGRPSTRVFNVNSILPWDAQALGAGFTIMQDELGFSKNIGMELALAPHFEVAGGILSVGLGLGFNNQSFNNVEWSTAGGSLPSTDPLIPKDESVLVFDLSAGVHYKAQDFYLGVAARHLNGPTLEYNENSSSFLKQNFYINGGYHYTLPNPLFEITPSVFIKSDLTAHQIDFNAVLEYNKQFWGGVSYRMSDAYVAMFGVNLINGISVGMAWDFPANALGTYAAGSVEFFGRYVFDLGLQSGPTRGTSILNRGR